jgi:hypothetical protein
MESKKTKTEQQFTLPKTLRVEATFVFHWPFLGDNQKVVLSFDVIQTQRVQDLEDTARAKFEEFASHPFQDFKWMQHAKLESLKVSYL